MAVICAVILILFGFAGCTKTVYVPTETVHKEYHTDTLRLVSQRTDSVYHRDSIYIEGEAIVKERWRYKYVTKTDTVYKAKTDTVHHFVDVTQIVEIEEKLHWWQKALMWIGGFALVSIVGYSALRKIIANK